MNPAKNEETTIGYYLSTDIASFHLDFGIDMTESIEKVRKSYARRRT